jgi:uncharacterized Tic20 family protein
MNESRNQFPRKAKNLSIRRSFQVTQTITLLSSCASHLFLGFTHSLSPLRVWLSVKGLGPILSDAKIKHFGALNG